MRWLIVFILLFFGFTILVYGTPVFKKNIENGKIYSIHKFPYSMESGVTFYTENTSIEMCAETIKDLKKVIDDKDGQIKHLEEMVGQHQQSLFKRIDADYIKEMSIFEFLRFRRSK